MMNALKKLLAVVAAITMWATIQPGTLSAQTSGIGGDAGTRLLWRGTDNRISLWKLNPNLSFNSSLQYGPFDTWLPIAITTRNDNNTVVLWRRTDGLISVWLVDANLNFQFSKVYGPFLGWIAESLSVDTNGNDWCRVIWRETGGLVGVWSLNQNLDLVTAVAYGPFFGFDPGSAAATRKPDASGPAGTKAAAAMGTNPSSPKPFPALVK
jgi:hypothetical protein